MLRFLIDCAGNSLGFRFHVLQFIRRMILRLTPLDKIRNTQYAIRNRLVPLALAVVLLTPFSSRALTPSDRIVVMISVDGLPADYLDDPKADLPTIRALAAGGARAKGMTAVSPTVTWPNHTTLVTGVYPARHGVVGNNYLDRSTGKHVVLLSDPVLDKDQIVRAATIYDLAHEAGLKTAALRWPASRNAATLDWTIPDVKLVDLLEKYSTSSLLKEVEGAGITLFDRNDPKVKAGTEPVPSDDVCVKIFNLIVHNHRPNLALLHLVDVDHTEHTEGPRTREAYMAAKKADQQVRLVWDELQRDFPGKATLFVVSDHGFSATKDFILPNVVLRKAGLITMSGKNEGEGPVHVVVQGGAAMVYIRDESHRGEIASRVKKAFRGVDGVSKVLGPDEIGRYGMANPKEDPHAPDMLLFAKEGWAFGDTAAGDFPYEQKPERKGGHGHDPAIPHLQATFVAWGEGIKPGARLGTISNLSVAPTIAELLGISIPNAQGKPLSAARER
jgi:predicted AlkP superfamily pyrophosphatase or phosphodiesterase